MSHVTVDLDGSVAELMLTRGAKRNALNKEMLADIATTVAELAKGGGTRALVVAAEGSVFCAGADLAEFRQLSDEHARAEWVSLGVEAFHALAAFPAPVVVAVQGGAFGGGLELALHCDFRILGADAVLVLPEAALGWLPEWGALQRLPHLVSPPRALQIILTGERIPATQALAWGLANEVCEEPLARARELARSLARIPPGVVDEVLDAVRPPANHTGGEPA